MQTDNLYTAETAKPNRQFVKDLSDTVFGPVQAVPATIHLTREIQK